VAKDTLTFELQGEVELQEFAKAINSFSLLITELSNNVGGGAKIEWLVDELHAGSAIATFRGVFPEELVVENVVNAYEQVGDALAYGKEIPFSETIRKHVAAFTSVLDNKITAIRFETPTSDYLVSSKVQQGKKSEPIKYNYGTVKGTIETLTKHKKLSFTLWDALFDKPVHCYFKPGEEENMRSVWGKKVVVSGRVGRQPKTGKPLIIRDVNYVRPLEEAAPGSFRRARGVLSWGKGGETAEEMIRRLRDAH